MKSSINIPAPPAVKPPPIKYPRLLLWKPSGPRQLTVLFSSPKRGVTVHDREGGVIGEIRTDWVAPTDSRWLDFEDEITLKND